MVLRICVWLSWSSQQLNVRSAEFFVFRKKNFPFLFYFNLITGICGGEPHLIQTPPWVSRGVPDDCRMKTSNRLSGFYCSQIQSDYGYFIPHFKALNPQPRILAIFPLLLGLGIDGRWEANHICLQLIGSGAAMENVCWAQGLTGFGKAMEPSGERALASILYRAMASAASCLSLLSSAVL